MVLELLQHCRLMSQGIKYLQFSSLNMQHCKLRELILLQSRSTCKLLIVLLTPCLSADSFAECYHHMLHSCVFLSVNSVSCDHSPGTDHVENYFGRTGMSAGRSQRSPERRATQAAPRPGANSAWAPHRYELLHLQH